MDGDKTMNTKTTNSKEIFTRSTGYQVKGQRKTTKRVTEPCPINDFDAMFGEYQSILEEEKVLSDRKKAIKKWALKECLSLEEEGEATTLESSDGQMTFSIRRDKTYQFHPWVEALIAAQKNAPGPTAFTQYGWTCANTPGGTAGQEATFTLGVDGGGTWKVRTCQHWFDQTSQVEMRVSFILAGPTPVDVIDYTICTCREFLFMVFINHGTLP